LLLPRARYLLLFIGWLLLTTYYYPTTGKKLQLHCITSHLPPLLASLPQVSKVVVLERTPQQARNNKKNHQLYILIIIILFLDDDGD
jgi:hypothetical protein